jgi:dolichol-phosphate mannosyltransferase
MHDPVVVSIVIPIKDEAANIEGLAQELTAVMDGQPWAWECLWVDDGSTDSSLEQLEQVAAHDAHHRYLSFEANAGQSAAFWAGFEHARGAILATLDGDGQNDPADLPKLVQLVVSHQTDMANGYRNRRQDHLGRKLASRIANSFRNAVTGRSVRDVGCSTRVFRRECVLHLPLFAGMHRFLPTLVAQQGFRIAELPVNHRPRRTGVTKYTIRNRLWVGLLDTFGVWWLRRRAFHYRVRKASPARSPDRNR